MSGQLVTRIGRYKGLALGGGVITTVGLLLLAVLDVSTTFTAVVRNMVAIGFGLGITMPIFTLAVQNAVDPHEVGVATASISFVRSMGGSLGAAVFGALLINRYRPALHAALPADFATHAPVPLMRALENPQTLMNPAALRAFDGHAGQIGLLLASVRQAFATSLHDVFLSAAVLVSSGIVVTSMLVDLPLRTTNRQSAVVEPEPV